MALSATSPGASLVLQHGDFVADAAYFVGEGACRFVPGKSFLKPALPAGYDYDGINAEVLRTRASVKDGRLVLPNGPSYRYLVLCDPQCTTMSAATLGRIRQLVEQGLSLVGKRPKRTPGLAGLPAAEAELRQGRRLRSGELPRPSRATAKWAEGEWCGAVRLGELLAADGVLPDCEAAGGEQTVRDHVAAPTLRRGRDLLPRQPAQTAVGCGRDPACHGGKWRSCSIRWMDR